MNKLPSVPEVDPAVASFVPLDGTLALSAPEVEPAEPHVDPSPVPLPTSWLRRLLHGAGVDRAVAFTVLARGWSSLAGIGTLTLITRFLSPAEQGFYYTFYSLVAIQIVFELGFSVVILQTASHEAAHLNIAPDGSITGPAREHGRLASVLQKAVRWYGIAGVLMAVTLLPLGAVFFSHSQRGAAGSIRFMLPWILIVLASSLTFQVDPIFSFLEGCGYVPEVARTRLRQSVAGTVLGWSAFLLHRGLFAPGCMILGQALAGTWFLASKRSLLLGLLRHRAEQFRIAWRSEVWPFQWRIAVSWLSGYFVFQLFNPILLAYRGPVEAGQMGMSLNICGTLSSMTIAWMYTKAAPFGRMVARREFGRLDQVFSRALLQSVIAAIVVCAAVWGVLRWLALTQFRVHGELLAHRVLPSVPLALLLLATVCNIVVFAEALYLRAHKQEKFMALSVASALYTIPVAFLLGRSHASFAGAYGIAAAYAFGTATIGMGYGTYTFLKWRRIWHAV